MLCDVLGARAGGREVDRCDGMLVLLQPGNIWPFQVAGKRGSTDAWSSTPSDLKLVDHGADLPMARHAERTSSIAMARSREVGSIGLGQTPCRSCPSAGSEEC